MTNQQIHNAAQWLVERGMQDRPVSPELGHELERAGLYEFDREEHLLEFTRDVIRHLQRIAEKAGDYEHLPCNGVRSVVADGNTEVQHYWFMLGDATVNEAARESTKRRRREATLIERNDYFDRFCEGKFGERKFRQAKLRFMQAEA